ncbi:MAG: hypothetical protein WC530_00495 [Candidatus Omnitrophota bacterium]|jgi:hypothetical protein
MDQTQTETQNLYQTLKNSPFTDETVYKYLSVKDLREMIDMAKKEGFALGHKLGLEHGEARGQKQAYQEVDNFIKNSLFKGLEVIVKFGWVVLNYVAPHMKDAVEILSYKINFIPSQNQANVLFVIKCDPEKEFEFSKILDSFEDLAFQFDKFVIESNFINEKTSELDYRLIQFDYPKSLDLAFVKNAFPTK